MLLYLCPLSSSAQLVSVLDIRSLTWDEWSYPEGVIRPIVPTDPRIAQLREMPWCFSNKLNSETQVSGRLGMSGGRSPYRASEGKRSQ